MSHSQLPGGCPLWSTDPLDGVTIETLGDSATVLIVDQTGVFEPATHPQLLPPLIWAGWLPPQRGGG